MEDKDPFGECFSLLFNLIISQLFIGAISSLIELIRIFALNILSNYILKEEYIQKYGIYIQPLITCILLIFIGMTVYYVMKWTTSDVCDQTDIVRYIIYFILIAILIGFFFFGFFYYYRIKRKEKSLSAKKIQYHML